MRALALKAGATALTMAAAFASAVYVGGHLKNAGAPLHPAVVPRSPAASTTAGGRLSVSPSVRSGDVEAVTSTYAS
jgi:hypothetical protein